MDIQKIDKNFAVKTDIGKGDIKFYNIDDAPFTIYGVFKENGKWRRGLILYQTLYDNPDGKFFARTPEDFFENFEEIDEVTDED